MSAGGPEGAAPAAGPTGTVPQPPGGYAEGPHGDPPSVSAGRPGTVPPPPGGRIVAPRIRLESDEALPAQPAPAAPAATAGGNPVGAAQAQASAGAPQRQPQPVVVGVRVQPVPTAAVSALPPERGLERERAWLRKTFSAQFSASSGSIARVLSQSPGLRSATRQDAADALTDLVALRLYLTGDSAQVDAAVRGATVGPHVPLVRCVTAGLRRLPSYRGPALLHAPAGAKELAWFHDGRITTEWAPCSAWTAAYPAPPGTVDFLVWSMTARRTRLVDTDATDRVIFEPGARFKVLRTDHGERTAVLLREIPPSEAGVDGAAQTEPLPLDELALNGLTASLATLRESRNNRPHGPAQQARPQGVPPGLLPPAGSARPASSSDGAHQ